MNAPERYESIVLPEGVKKISWKKDTKIPNAATFEFQREDHTLGNLLRTYLLKSPKVIFAGYRMPHPLDPKFELKIQTTKDTTPDQVLSDVMNNLMYATGKLKDQFQAELARKSPTQRLP